MRTNRLTVGLLVACVAFVGLSSANADMILSPSASGGVHNTGAVNLPNTIAGGANNGEWRTIYEFSTATMPAASNIGQVLLKGNQVAAGGFLPVYLHHIPADGIITAGDYASAQIASLGVLIPLGGGNGPFSMDVTSAVLSDLNNSRTFSGFRLLAPGYPQGLYRVFSGVTLEITEVPEPATLSLLGVGAVAGLYRRKRN